MLTSCTFFYVFCYLCSYSFFSFFFEIHFGVPWVQHPTLCSTLTTSWVTKWVWLNNVGFGDGPMFSFLATKTYWWQIVKSGLSLGARLSCHHDGNTRCYILDHHLVALLPATCCSAYIWDDELFSGSTLVKSAHGLKDGVSIFNESSAAWPIGCPAWSLCRSNPMWVK